MAETPSTIHVTHDELATSIIRTGQKLIELGMQLREGFDVNVSFANPPEGCESRLDASHVCTRDEGHKGNHCDIEDPSVEWADFKRMVGRKAVTEPRRVPTSHDASERPEHA